MGNMRIARGVCWILLVLWVYSFFLPAERIQSIGVHEMNSGWDVAVTSLVLFWVPYYGQLWIANVLMLLAPIFLERLKNGKGRAYVVTLSIFAILPLAFPLIPHGGILEQFKGLESGFYLWEISLLGMMALCMAVASASKQTRRLATSAGPAPQIPQTSNP